MAGYPILLSLEGRTVVVIGAGKVAGRKIGFLVEAGARVKVVSPTAENSIHDLAEAQKIDFQARPYVRGDLEGAWLAFAATNDSETNMQVWEEAQSRDIPINVATDPGLCDFTVPSMVRRGDLCIAISTGAASPRLARKIRERLEKEYGPEYETLLEILGEARQKIVASGEEEAAKRDLIDRVLSSDILNLIRSGDVEGARKLADGIAAGE